jgi:hypothetical protein
MSTSWLVLQPFCTITRWIWLDHRSKLIWTSNGVQWKVLQIVFFKLYVMYRCKKGCNTKRCSCKKADLQCTDLCQCENMESTELIVILIRKIKGMKCCARVSSRSWGETSTQRAAMKKTMLPQKILKIKCPTLAKNAFAMQHLLHHSIIYTFIQYHTMNEDGCTYNCISELISTEQVTFFLLVTIFSLNFSFYLNFWSRGLILFPPLYVGDPRACSRQPTASL